MVVDKDGLASVVVCVAEGTLAVGSRRKLEDVMWNFKCESTSDTYANAISSRVVHNLAEYYLQAM